MDTSLDKFYRLCVDMNRQLPEAFIAHIALSVGVYFWNKLFGIEMANWVELLFA